MTDGALAGLRVIDAATLAAGPLIATWMGEQGAEVIKVEQPDGGDPLRQWGAQRDGIGLMWKSVARNKKCVTLNLRLEAGRDLLRSLTRQADVLIMNLRPSTLRKWDLEYESLAAANPRLVMVHVTGYGAGGPKSDWPGFGTLGEAMSGFAHLTGTPDGPPTLPSFMLADGVAALNATYAVMMALYHRDAHGGPGGGRGQLIDINLIEPLARLLEQSVLTYDQLGTIPVRTGNRWDISAPRNTYQTSDGRWLAMSGSAPTIAMRALRAVGRPELTGPEVRRGAAAAAERGRDRRDHGGLDRPAHPGRGPGRLRGGGRRRRAHLRRRAAARRSPAAGPRGLRAGSRSRARPDAGPGARSPLLGHPGPGHPSGPAARGGQRRGLPAACSVSTTAASRNYTNRE